MKRCRGAALFSLLCAACDGTRVDLERMIDQHKYEAYEASPLFADGKAMRTPPPKSVPRSAAPLENALATGMEDGTYLDQLPLPVTQQLLARGQNRFEIYCATCHGRLGDGKSRVAPHMRLRRPPSLHEARIAALPVGEIYAVVREGKGLMPSYAGALSIGDRWAVVAYLGALQLSQNVPLAALPPDLQREARPWLP